MNSWKLFSDIASIVSSVSTFLLVVVGTWQIVSIRREAKKERTLNACNIYITDPTIDASARRLRAARFSGEYNQNRRTYRSDVITLLNYLDTVAIGIAQGLYIESLARDH